MEEAKRNAVDPASSSSLKQALLILSGAISVGYMGSANAQATAQSGAAMLAPKVSIDEVVRPKNQIVKTPKTWTRIEIELTPEQQAQLAKQGVQTDKLRITTYDIQRVAGNMIN